MNILFHLSKLSLMQTTTDGVVSSCGIKLVTTAIIITYYPKNYGITPFSEQTPSVSFTRGMYSVREDEEVLTVTVERSGDSDSHVMVHIATHPSEGTATGLCNV